LFREGRRKRARFPGLASSPLGGDSHRYGRNPREPEPREAEEPRDKDRDRDRDRERCGGWEGGGG
jgi:hypothetical protein